MSTGIRLLVTQSGTPGSTDWHYQIETPYNAMQPVRAAYVRARLIDNHYVLQSAERGILGVEDAQTPEDAQRTDSRMRSLLKKQYTEFQTAGRFQVSSLDDPNGVLAV